MTRNGTFVFTRIAPQTTKAVVREGVLNGTDWLQEIPDVNRGALHVVLTDHNVAPLFGESFIRRLASAGLRTATVSIEAGEASKSITTYIEVMNDLLNMGLDRDSTVFTLGGGVVANLGGFVASTLYRGVRLVHIPTTLLAQIDAAVDFKQAVNTAAGKNLVGSYYPATLVVIDPSTLSTLPTFHVRNGLAEAIKHALVQDGTFFEFLKTYDGDYCDPDFLGSVVRKVVSLKAHLFSTAIHDRYAEMIGQYGHAVAHALEHVSKYQLHHGQAVAIGMCVMAEYGHITHWSSTEVVLAHYHILRKFDLPCVVPDDIDQQAMFDALRRDKHFVNGHLATSLPAGIGSLATNEGSPCIEVEMAILGNAVACNRQCRFSEDV